MTTILSGSQVSPSGDPGPLPPAAISADAGNIATLGSDNLILVPQQTIWYQRLRAFNALGNSTFEINQSRTGSPDRWIAGGNQAASCTIAQATQPSPLYVPGTSFRLSAQCVSITLNTQKATLVTTDALYLTQNVEGPQFRELIGDVHTPTLAVYTSVAGLKFGVCLRDPGAAWSLTYLCTVLNANQWTFITLPSCPVWASGGNFSTNPGVLGYCLFITLAGGPSFINPTTGSWTAGNLIAATGQDNFMSKPVGSVFYVGFVDHQPGAGSVPMDLPWLDNLRACQRYYCKSVGYLMTPCQGNWQNVGTLVPSTTSVRCGVRYPVDMAKVPTIRISGNSATLNTVYVEGQGQVSIASATGYSSGINAITLSAASTVGSYADVLGDWDASTGW